MKEKLDYSKYKELCLEYEKIVSRFANVRMFMFIIMVISFIVKYYYCELFFNIVFFISLVMFLFLVFIHDKYFKIYNYYVKYLNILEEYVARENGEWKNFKDQGADFLDDNSYFLSDLDIVGNSSLFQYLSICKTLGGRDKLMSRLSNLSFDKDELESRQELVKELVKDVDFCIKFQIAISAYQDKDVNLSKGLNKFDKLDDRLFDVVIGIIAFVITIILCGLGLLKVIPMAYFYGMFFFNLLISFLYAYIFREEFRNIDKMISYYGGLVDVFYLIGNYKANSSLMKKFVKGINNSLNNLLNLKRLDSINSLRSNFLSNFLLNGFCCLNLFVRFKYSLFVNKSYDVLKNNVDSVEELEAMISLANIGIVKKDCCIPIVSEKINLKFNSLKHPLIDESVCVSNDFGGKAGVNIITGSNMGGKTTFIRTVGINLILMQAGSYVCGNYLEASYFKIFTSMRIVDNIDKGISTFYGELLRIRDMVNYDNKGNMIVLIDEIFKGTNYSDRIYGAKEVVNKLNNKNTIAFITTHDFELCDSEGVVNYHFKEDYEGDKIVFDYKIREGKCTSTNAKYLMKKLDIIN